MLAAWLPFSLELRSDWQGRPITRLPKAPRAYAVTFVNAEAHAVTGRATIYQFWRLRTTIYQFWRHISDMTVHEMTKTDRESGTVAGNGGKWREMAGNGGKWREAAAKWLGRPWRRVC
jgi:hypothetical protein